MCLSKANQKIQLMLLTMETVLSKIELGLSWKNSVFLSTMTKTKTLIKIKVLSAKRMSWMTSIEKWQI